jgi:mannose-6-phosphate isomerase-like protein (cupin superfamily)
MRALIVTALLCGVCVSAAAQTAGSPPTLPATDVTAAAMKKFIDAMPKDAITDAPIRVVDVGSHRVGIFGVFRPKTEPGDAIAHETKTTEVYYILEGAGVLVTGGIITDLKPPPPGRNPGPRGNRIEGGVSRRVSAGDLIVIPGRTPHWWSSLEGDIRYMIVRSDPVGTMNLK